MLVFEGLILQLGATSILSSVTLEPIVFVDMTMAMSTDLISGEAESAGRAVEYVGIEAFGEFGGVEEKMPKQSSGHVVRR